MSSTYNPILLAFVASLFTWFCTSIGAGAVFLEGKKRFSNSLMEGLFGLSAGVMLAASFFSLLSPALEMSKHLTVPAWFPLLIGFAGGVAFIKIMDVVVPEDPTDGCFSLCIRSNHKVNPPESNVTDLRTPVDLEEKEFGQYRDRHTSRPTEPQQPSYDQIDLRSTVDLQRSLDFTAIDKEVFHVPKKMFLLALAVTIHNIPEGLVLGMAFGGLAHENGTKLHDAVVLTLALGLQNIPEGLAISIPIWRSGSRRLTSFCYGQFSGLVEVFAAIVGALLVMTIKAILPYALSFAAGAMIYVVCNELIPASQVSQKQSGIFGIMFGFTLMMTLDIAFE